MKVKMDPDGTLLELRQLAANQLVGVDCDPDRMAELVEALHEWIVGGGYLPLDWSQRIRSH